MKTNLRLVGACLALLLLTATQVPAQEVRQAMADTFDVLRQATWWNDWDGSFNEAPAEDNWCGEDGCGCCNECKPIDAWAQLEYLMWWGKGSFTPALVTTSSQADAGVLGRPTTQILFGNETLGDEIQSGVRLNAGVWLDASHNVGLGVRTFGLEGDSANFFATSTGDPVLARPYFNALILDEDARAVALTGVAEGSIRAGYNSSFGGTDVYTRIMMERCRINRVDLVGGYSYFRLADTLAVRSITTARDVVNDGTVFDVRDNFSTSNVFHGGMLGLTGSKARGRWSLDWLTKVSLGSSSQRVRISGSTVTTPLAGVPTTSQSGFLAQPSNIGVYEQNQFVVIPELTANVNYHMNSNWSVGIGYNLIWMSSAATAGPQIDRSIDTLQIIPRPAFNFNTDDYWVMGMNFSLKAEY
ncbi:BBP7 family outer membrane beta-barrel protein [Anatilimnocola floriformis]|uniref:BBP7 family outer membrane beta-barrel protein n=1 Tax=Anatilimnocola floriformis TaxID=2948575 RepID=UPI0020C4C776|nr:BBP7 family outer membrane beta-barrel protein [Anatilimnocola floriformis]